MIRFVINKIKNKMWLNICLIIGVILLMAMFSIHPLLSRGSENRLIKVAFDDKIKKDNVYSATNSIVRDYGCKEGGLKAQELYDYLDMSRNDFLNNIDISFITYCDSLFLSSVQATSNLRENGNTCMPVCLNDIDEHFEYIDKLDNPELPDNTYMCYVPKQCAINSHIVCGEIFTNTVFGADHDKEINFLVTGIVEEKDENDLYFGEKLIVNDFTLYLTRDTFTRILDDYQIKNVSIKSNSYIDYTGIDMNNINAVLDRVESLSNNYPGFMSTISETLRNFKNQKNKMNLMLTVLEIPCIVFLLLFLFMVINEFLKTEKEEIAVMRSRGAKRLQIIRIYTFQAIFITVICLVPGILLGRLLSIVAANSSGFLKLSGNPDMGLYTFPIKTIGFAIAAGIIFIILMTFNAAYYSKDNIIENKAGKHAVSEKKSILKYIIYFIMLAFSIYLLFNYKKQEDVLANNALSGKSTDILLHLASSIFIISLGLIFIEIVKYIIAFINKCFNKKWSAASYSTYLKLIRGYKNNRIVAIFLIMTVAIGLFQANLARTIRKNIEERTQYNNGADIVVTEKWDWYGVPDTSGNFDYRKMIVKYEEPDINRYDTLVKDGIISSYSKVYSTNSGNLVSGSNKINCQLMGVETDTYGKTAKLDPSLNDSHWYNYLNELAKNPSGVLISRNLADTYGFDVGNTISISDANSQVFQKGGENAVFSYTIVGIVDAMPGYTSKYYKMSSENEIKENDTYMVMGNYGKLRSNFDILPYEIWMDLEEGTKVSDVYDILSGDDFKLDKFKASSALIDDKLNESIIKITNGMFTISFIISVSICVIGFLIYWIMSIKSRELHFGIFRAMGMHMKDIWKQLIIEQLFCTMLPVIMGGILGMGSTLLFAKLVSISYLPEKHNIPIRFYIQTSDIFLIYGIMLIAVILCFAVLRRIIKKMKIAQALKLGED